MKQIISFLIPFVLLITLVLNQVLPADAAKKAAAKKKGVSQEIVLDYANKIDNLTKKIYERELFTPEDSKALIEVKLQLDNQMDTFPEAVFAPLYFKLGNIFRLRDEKQDAIVCYQTVLENFADTAYGPKSRDILIQMGVEIKTPTEEESFDDEEFGEEEF